MNCVSEILPQGKQQVHDPGLQEAAWGAEGPPACTLFEDGKHEATRRVTGIHGQDRPVSLVCGWAQASHLRLSVAGPESGVEASLKKPLRVPWLAQVQCNVILNILLRASKTPS